MACDYCNGLECHVDGATYLTVYVTPDGCLAVDDGSSYTAMVPIRYCPWCGQDLREVTCAER